MSDVPYEELLEEFHRRAARIVWCVVATVDTAGRPRTRVLHPVWEGRTAWIGTRPASLKAKHVERTPWVSLTYWDQEQAVAGAECSARWQNDGETRKRVWDLFATTPPPYGFDPTTIWPGGVDDPGFGVLRLDAWRLEVSGLPEQTTGLIRRAWQDPAGPSSVAGG